MALNDKSPSRRLPTVSWLNGERRLPGPHRWSLAARFTLAVILLLLPLQVVVMVTNRQVIKERLSAEMASSQFLSRTMAAVVDGFVRDLDNFTLTAALALGSRIAPLNQDTVGPYLSAVVSNYGVLRAIFVTDLEGKVIASGTGDGLGLDLSDRPYMADLRAGREPVWTGGFPALQTGEIIVAHGRAIRSPQGELRGYLVAAFYPARLVERLPNILPEDARILVLDHRGFLLFSSDHPDLLPEERYLGADTAVAQALTGRSVPLRGEPGLLEEDARYGALVPVPHTGWVLGVTRPLAPLQAAAQRRFLQQSASISLVVLLAAILMALVASRLSRPLRELTGAASAIARGERPAILHADGGYEVRELARAMRSMSAAVAQREGALQRAAAQRAAVAELGRLALSGIELDELFAEAVTRVSDALGLELVKLLELEHHGRSLLLRAGVGWQPGLVGHERLSSGSESQAGFTLLTKEPVVVADLSREERFRAAPLLLRHEVRSGLSVVIHGRSHPFGVLGAHTTELRTFSREEVHFLQAVANVLADAVEGKRSEQMLSLLARAGEALASSLDYEQTLQQVARLAVPAFADGCLVHLTEEGGLRTVGFAISDPEKEAAMRQLQRRYPIPLDRQEGIPQALRSGEPLLYSEVTEDLLRRISRDEEHLKLHRRLQPTSALIVPLKSRRATLGTLTFLQLDSIRRYQQEDVGFALEIARRCSAAIENSSLYRDLEEAVRSRDEFLSSAAHDLRNPLTAVRGMAQLLRQRLYRELGQAPEWLPRGLQQIESTSRRMASLVEQLQDVARLQMGQTLELKPEPTDLVRLLQDLVEEHQRASDHHSFGLVVEREEILGSWDGQRLERVLANLLSNAVKYSPRGGEIHAHLDVEEVEGRPWARVLVRDEGLGIPAEDLPRVFERFYRGRNVQGRIPGAGIGLAAARQIVEQHGGTLSVESEEGRGSTFIVRLPLQGGEQQPGVTSLRTAV